MKASELKKQFTGGQYKDLLLDLYEDEALIGYQEERYGKALDRFVELYGDKDVEMYSAAGRSEVGGNHTDHQHGCVLAASINLDTIGIVAKKEGGIKVVSDNFDVAEIKVDDLEKKDKEEGTSESLIRGVTAKIKEEGYAIGGFEAYMTSDVLVGAGLSSSASFETIIGTVLSGLYNENKIDSVEIAKIGQYAENVYFGKPCGLMDQCACSVGGLITIDFNDPAKPIVKHVDVDFSTFKHSLCIVDTKGSHADLTNEYAAVPAEMKKVAHFFGKEFLRDVNEEDFYASYGKVREACEDRPALRAFHFFDENRRVGKQVLALEEGRFDDFKALVQSSGNSSYKFLQNVFAASDPMHQNISSGLAMSEHLLGTHGVSRVHGGGFAGTIQAFVEDEYVEGYKKGMEAVFGEGTCHVLKVRKYGGKKIL